MRGTPPNARGGWNQEHPHREAPGTATDGPDMRTRAGWGPATAQLLVAVALAGILDSPTVALLPGPSQILPSPTRFAAGWHASAGSQVRGWGHAGGSTSRHHTPLQEHGALDGRRHVWRLGGGLVQKGARFAGLVRLRGGGLFKKMKRGQPLSVAEKVGSPAVLFFMGIPWNFQVRGGSLAASCAADETPPPPSVEQGWMQMVTKEGIGSVFKDKSKKTRRELAYARTKVRSTALDTKCSSCALDAVSIRIPTPGPHTQPWPPAAGLCA